MTTTEEGLSYTAEGAKVLDRVLPDWYKYPFDWDSFNIHSCYYCILGQLGKDSATPWEAYNTAYDYIERRGESGDKRGFASGGSPIDGQNSNDFYRDAWKAEVQKRLNAITFPPEHTVTLNPTERQLLIDMLEVREHELTEELGKLKPQYREFLNPAIMTTRALRLAVQGA